jgi:hypothetical protein
MKTKFVLAAIFTFIFSAAAFAQTDLSVSAPPQIKAADYSGKWNLEVKKSKLKENPPIESMTMIVEQNEREVKIESSFKNGEDANTSMSRGGGLQRGSFSGMNGGTETTSYTLDGKEVINDMTKAAAGKFTYKGARSKDGKLKLEQTREFQSPTGMTKIKTTESWSLSADGKTLTINRETVNPSGTTLSEMVFMKQ